MRSVVTPWKYSSGTGLWPVSIQRPGSAATAEPGSDERRAGDGDRGDPGRSHQSIPTFKVA